eukprot:1587541-Alexandrium_andersonii.AAC.1
MVAWSSATDRPAGPCCTGADWSPDRWHAQGAKRRQVGDEQGRLGRHVGRCNSRAVRTRLDRPAP